MVSLSACAILESVVVLGKRSPSCLAIGLGTLDISGGGRTRSSSLGGMIVRVPFVPHIEVPLQLLEYVQYVLYTQPNLHLRS